MTGTSVLLSDPTGVETGALALFLSAEKKIPLIDAQRLARHAWGFLGQGLEESSARALVHSAEAAGIKTCAVRDDAVPLLSAPAPAHGARFDEDRVTFAVGIPSAPRSVDLSKIKLLSVACLRRDTYVTKTTTEEVSAGRRLAGLGIMLTTGIPVGLGKRKETQKTVAETEWVLFLDVFGDGGRWRVVPAGFDFFGLGSEKVSVGSENLRRLFLLFHKRAPSAMLNRGARWWLEGRPLNAAGYDEMTDVDQESRWLLTLANQML